MVLCFARDKYIGVSSALRIIQNLATVVAYFFFRLSQALE